MTVPDVLVSSFISGASIAVYHVVQRIRGRRHVVALPVAQPADGRIDHHRDRPTRTIEDLRSDG